VRSEGIDVIFATCPPHSANLIGAVLKLLTGKPLILDFRDDWIDTPWYHSKPAMIRMIERWLESWAVRTADKVILVTEWSKKAFLDRYPTERSEKFVFISNGCDLGDFPILNSMSSTRRNSKFTIVHAGSMNVSKFWGRSPETLFQVIHQMLLQEPDLAEKVTLVFAGEIPEEHRRLAEEMGVSGVFKGLGHLPHGEVLRLIKSADLLLAMNYEGWSTLIPGKIYEYWAIGGPPILLLSCRGAASELIEKYGIGMCVDTDDVKGIAGAIYNSLRKYESGESSRISCAGIESFDRKTLTTQLDTVLREVS
jgi:glycosyltransferase involved in cell wall biosynthesis